jgi:hypothetical protein
MILGAYIIYDLECFIPLAVTLASLLSLKSDSIAILTADEPTREGLFTQLLPAFGLVGRRITGHALSNDPLRPTTILEIKRLPNIPNTTSSTTTLGATNPTIANVIPPNITIDDVKASLKSSPSTTTTSSSSSSASSSSPNTQ